MAKAASKCCQILNKPSINYKRHFKCCKSSEISRQFWSHWSYEISTIAPLECLLLWDRRTSGRTISSVHFIHFIYLSFFRFGETWRRRRRVVLGVSPFLRNLYFFRWVFCLYFVFSMQLTVNTLNVKFDCKLGERFCKSHNFTEKQFIK